MERSLRWSEFSDNLRGPRAAGMMFFSESCENSVNRS
jgi:hypothetical protein